VVINRADAVASDSFPALSRHACGAPRGQLTALLEVGLTSPNRIGAPPPSRDLGADASGSNPGSKLRQASATQDNSNPLKTAETPLHNHVLPGGPGPSRFKSCLPDSKRLLNALFSLPADRQYGVQLEPRGPISVIELGTGVWPYDAARGQLFAPGSARTSRPRSGVSRRTNGGRRASRAKRASGRGVLRGASRWPLGSSAQDRP
jgi:hypothetical protein